MSERYSECVVCKGKYHVCMSCDVDAGEREAADWGLCSQCWVKSGAEVPFWKAYMLKHDYEEMIQEYIAVNQK